jgi:putative oxidoreductase
MAQFQVHAHALLRIIAGFAFSLHGMQKLFGALGGLGGGASASMWTLMWVAGVIECFGGLLILVGLFTKPVALISCGEMAVAYFMQHFPKSFWPIKNGGELAVLYCFIFLYLAVAGAGIWSLDAIMRKKSG